MKTKFITDFLSHMNKNKLYALLLSIILFSIIYMFLDDKHFSGVNVVKETIKEEVIKKEIKEKVDTTPKNVDTFSTYGLQDDSLSKEIDKATQEVKEDVKEDELSADKIESSYFQKLFNRLYFSIITTTLLGYGDIYPVSNIAKIVVMSQSLITVALIVA